MSTSAPASGGMRITELAARSGVSVRTIRFYQESGVLPRPRMRGRVGWYGEEHLERLAFVGRLQQRGYSLAAVADMVAAQVPDGLSAGEAYDVVQPALLRAGVALVARGVPVEVALAELDRLRAELGVIAERFALILRHDLLPGYLPDGTSREVLEEVLPAILVATGSVLREALERALSVRPKPPGPPLAEPPHAASPS